MSHLFSLGSITTVCILHIYQEVLEQVSKEVSIRRTDTEYGRQAQAMATITEPGRWHRPDLVKKEEIGLTPNSSPCGVQGQEVVATPPLPLHWN